MGEYLLSSGHPSRRLPLRAMAEKILIKQELRSYAELVDSLRYCEYSNLIFPARLLSFRPPFHSKVLGYL